MGWARRAVDWFRHGEANWSIASLLLGFLATKVSWLAWPTRHVKLRNWALGRADGVQVALAVRDV